MQILLIAFVLALLFKKPPDDDSYKTKVIVECGPVDLPKINYRSLRARISSNRPPPKSVLAADRYKLQVDEKMGVIFRDLVLYSLFLVIVLVTIYLMSDPNIFDQNDQLNKLFDLSVFNLSIILSCEYT